MPACISFDSVHVPAFSTLLGAETLVRTACCSAGPILHRAISLDQRAKGAQIQKFGRRANSVPSSAELSIHPQVAWKLTPIATCVHLQEEPVCLVPAAGRSTSLAGVREICLGALLQRSVCMLFTYSVRYGKTAWLQVSLLPSSCYCGYYFYHYQHHHHHHHHHDSDKDHDDDDDETGLLLLMYCLLLLLLLLLLSTTTIATISITTTSTAIIIITTTILGIVILVTGS